MLVEVIKIIRIVDGNDAIFIGDEIYISAGKGLMQRVIERMCEIVNDYDSNMDKVNEASNCYGICLKIANILIGQTKPKPVGVKIIQKFITLANKYQNMEPEVDPAYFKNTMAYYNMKIK